MKTIKMADAFGKLAGICAGLEGRYTPAHPNLLPSSLAAQLTGAQAAVQAVTMAERNMRLAVAERAQAFRELATVASRIRQSLLGNPALAATLADVDLPLKKLSGNTYRARRAVAFDASLRSGSGNSLGDTSMRSGSGNSLGDTSMRSGSGNSSSGSETVRSYAKGTDYLSRLAHFGQVVSALQRNQAYKASTADLNVTALTERHNQLIAIQKAYTDAVIELGEKRAAVHAAFHAPYTGLVDTSKAVRRSIRAQFGWRSPESRAIKGLRFY